MFDGALVTCSGADRNNLTFSMNLKESLRGIHFVEETAQSGGSQAQIRRTLISLAGHR